MRSGTIDHIGIAVKNIEKSKSFFQEIFGAGLLREKLVEEQKLISSVISLGSVNLELMQSTERNSIIDKYLTTHGEGVHHISIQVKDLDGLLRELASKNIRILNKFTNNDYRIVFIHPKNAFGLLIEIIERTGKSDDKG